MEKRITKGILKISLCFIFAVVSTNLMAQTDSNLRTRLFDEGWSFKLDSIESGPEKPDFDDSGWRKLDLPHDWSTEDVAIQIPDSIVGPFYRKSDGQTFDGFTYGGTGWYRKSFKLSKAEEGKNIFIQFDGVYMNSDVWINGHHLGNHPYGYTPFNYELTPYLNLPGQENVLVVKVRNEGKNSRWYAGSGIYRHVQLTVVNPLHIDIWGVNVTTPEVSETSAKVNVATTITNGEKKDEDFILFTQLFNAEGHNVGKGESKVTIAAGETLETSQVLMVENPALWSADSPNRYTVQVEIQQKAKTVDKVSLPVGIRDIKIDAKNGLLVNGKPVLLKGGCIHHDNGSLGSISIEAAEERKIKLLKESGFNAVRMSHNPPSSVLLEVCDRLGMYVIDEAFDAWKKTKFQDDYHLYFEENWDKDLTAMIHRDRNHPSIILWSIGNEIRERASDEGLQITQMLLDRVKVLDPTRKVTEAVCDFWDARRTYNWEEHTPAIFDILEVGGYNYMDEKYEADHEKYPDRIMLGTESYPSKAYEIWQLLQKHSYLIGDFVWTAMDYRGEAGCANTGFIKGKQRKTFVQWPWFNAFCGDLDFVGNKKPQSFYRDVVWDRSPIEMMVQKLEVPEGMRYYVNDWGWPDELKSWSWAGSEGDTLQVRVYTKSKLVKLELNGKLIGEQAIADTSITALFNVPYQPGTLVAKAYENGKEVSSTLLKTVGKPAAIRLIADRTTIKANRNDLAYVSVEIVDAEGNLVPYADDIEINYTITGPGEIAGVGNGNPIDISSFQQPKKKVYQGKGMVIVRPTGIPGEIILEAIAAGMDKDRVKITLH
ncbi:glycoside hydrolase family 2 TIM barrel-domain containing protein [Labilibaculum manganireducens]|uniref:glycoside hydrolase family 2 TIM barrel-domain containing protein n=1 Tax=Labilibaculum manganireducens TaxID=1940525 RepID=UPI000C6DC9DC|nr:glycoside hydrolase family 2 TIM barrel-domain containing protein [Labilibaculum manganireducens]